MAVFINLNHPHQSSAVEWENKGFHRGVREEHPRRARRRALQPEIKTSMLPVASD
jgi:hypothetical protein